MPKYSLRYVIVPPIALNITQAVGWYCVRIASGGSIKDALLVFGLVLALLGWPISLMLTYQFFLITDVEVKRTAYELRQNVEKTDDFGMQVLIDRGDGNLQADNFRGLTMRQWKDTADSISSTKKWTFATVGQTLHPKLTPMMLAAEYIEDAGAGKYDLTNTGLAFWNNLAARPYPWRDAPYIIRNLSMDDKYTQNI